MEVINREWQAHLCVPVEFHLNTLIILTSRLIVSTVGTDRFDIGAFHSYETYVFESSGPPHDMPDVEKSLHFEAYDTKREARKGHMRIVTWMINRKGDGAWIRIS